MDLCVRQTQTNDGQIVREENPSGSELPNEGDWGNLMELWYGVRSSKKQEEQEAQELVTASREATRVSDQQRSNMLARMANKRSVDSALSPERDEEHSRGGGKSPPPEASLGLDGPVNPRQSGQRRSGQTRSHL